MCTLIKYKLKIILKYLVSENAFLQLKSLLFKFDVTGIVKNNATLQGNV